MTLVGKVFALILRKDKYTKSKIIKQHSEERLDVLQKMKKNYSFPQDKEKYNSRSKE